MKNIFILILLCCPFFTTVIGITTPKNSDDLITNPPPECVGEQGKIRWFYWNDIPGPDISNLWSHPYFPQAPDGMLYRNKEIKTPFAFNDYFASMMRGFITVPETGDYTFNITGNDHALFYLSTDMSPDNLVLLAEGFQNLQTTQHDAQENQTSDIIHLEVDTYYYFEVFNKEWLYYDFAYVYWKTPSHPNEWRIVGDANIYDYTCETLCNPYGTACDDNDPNTTNDIEDGFCNCFGQAPPSSSCIGERGRIRALYYDGVGGNMISDLQNATIYPNQPTRGEVLNQFLGPISYADYYGSLIKAFLRVPRTGNYYFKLEADNVGQLFISNSESTAPEDMTLIADATYTAADTSGFVTLQADQYYYMELLHKENGGGEFFKVYWKLPYERYEGGFNLINSEFLYQYDCETICIPEGTPCNDQNEGTNNDAYNATCACVGIPCDTPDCSTDPNYVAYEVCSSTNQHSNNEIDSWLSCIIAPNPSGLLADGHWILYDLNEDYQVHQTHIWNYNEANETNKGFKNVNIDYSIDGITWTALGQTYEWPQATGTNNYEGFAGPDFGGVPARYILFSATSNWGTNETCSGFSEWKMALTECPQVNTPCDDGNPNNFNDAYNAACECVGRDEPLALNLTTFHAQWQQENVLIDWQSQQEEAGTYYEVQRGLDAQDFSSIGMLQGKSQHGENSNYQLLDTKGAQLATNLYYRLKIIEANGNIAYSHVVHLEQTNTKDKLQINAIQPNPFEETTLIEFFLPTAQAVRLSVFNAQGQLVVNLMQSTLDAGQHQVTWNGRMLGGKEVETGVYYVQLTDGRQRVARKVVRH